MTTTEPEVAYCDVCEAGVNLEVTERKNILAKKKFKCWKKSRQQKKIVLGFILGEVRKKMTIFLF